MSLDNQKLYTASTLLPTTPRSTYSQSTGVMQDLIITTRRTGVDLDFSIANGGSRAFGADWISEVWWS